MKNLTIVTGLWDIGRGDLSQGWSRSFDHYLQNFEKLLKNMPNNMIIFGEKELSDIVFKHRNENNTQFIVRNIDWFKNNGEIYSKIQDIRNDPEWYGQVGWLKDSTQARLEMYNPLVMSKMFLLNDASILDKFDSDYIFWLDAGITNTVHPGYFSRNKVLDKVPDIVDKFFFICFPYDTKTEIHGFKISEMNRYAKAQNVNRVARGGFFGGKKDTIQQANNTYHGLLSSSLKENLMGTEESIFTIMTYLEPEVYKYEPIKGNGLISYFFENVKNNTTDIQTQGALNKNKNNNISIYINTFNSSNQLQLLLDSFKKYEPKFLSHAKIVLINNTINQDALVGYDEIVKKYDMIEIREGNKGICGARQFAAEHFKQSGDEYMFFFEDDMLIDMPEKQTCNFGFSKKVVNLFDNLIGIMDNENYDFLKLSFSEFFGHNGDQWSWHNLPKIKKELYFDKNLEKRPPTIYKNIKSLNSVVYADGEIYYCNWPQIIGQKGNEKCFLETTWKRPYEQTWMSYMYMKMKEQHINPAILLHSPITHNRVYHYKKEERKES